MTFDLSKLVISIFLVGMFVGVDLWTKHEAWNSTVLHEGTIDLGDRVTLNEPVINYGGPGIFGSEVPNLNYRYWHIFVVVFSMGCFAALVLFNERIWHSMIGAAPVGGMCGNALELMIYGGATDFITFNGLGPLDGFIYNVADVFIVAGLPVYYLTSEMAPSAKLISLILCISIFSLTFGLLPSDPAVFMAIGCLFLLLFWPDTNNMRV